jgi:hypothetical protein
MGGMAGATGEQHKTFEARLKRISRGGPNTSGHVIVGPADVAQKARRPRRLRRPGDFLSRLGGAMGHLVVAPVSFALGALAMMGGIVAAHHADLIGLGQFTEAGVLERLALYKEFLFAGIVVVIFGWLLRLTRGPRKLAVVTGLVAVFVLQDQIIAAYPEVFARLMPDAPLTLPEFAALPDS